MFAGPIFSKQQVRKSKQNYNPPVSSVPVATAAWYNLLTCQIV